MKRFILFPIIFSLFCFLLSQARAEEILTWEDCLAEAKRNNPSLISAREGINEENAAKIITASGLYPQISADLDASTAKTTTATTTSTTDSYSYGVSGTQLIFDGFKTLNKAKAASEDIKSAQENYRFTSAEVRLDLRSAFINLLKAQELIKVTEEIVKIRKENLMLITLRYESGLEHKGALLTAETNLSQADFELSQAKRSLELAQRQLTREMGRKEFKPMSVRGDFTVKDTAKERPDLEAIARNNPSLLEALAKKNAQAFDIKSAYADFFPAVSGSASANKKSAHWPPENNNWNLGVSVTMPIFEGGLQVAEVSKEKALYNQLEAEERKTQDNVIVALMQYWLALQDALETVQVQLKSLESSQERSKVAEAQYSAGFITFDNWIIIENDLVAAKKAYLNALCNALFAEANWIYAKGETLEYGQK